MSSWRDRPPSTAFPLRAGGVRLGRVGRAPIHVYPIGIVGVSLLVGGLRFVPGVWLGVLLVVLVHELGHAFFVRRYRKELLGVEVNGLGGLCVWAGDATAMQRAVIAWGGVWAQLLLYGLTRVFLALVDPQPGPVGAQLLAVFTTTNLWMALVNLIPVPPLDGAEAWKLPELLRRRYGGYLRRQVAIAERMEQARPAPPPAPPPLPPDPSDDEIPASFRAEVNAMVDRVVREGARKKQ